MANTANRPSNGTGCQTRPPKQRSNTQATRQSCQLHRQYTIHYNKHATLAFTTRTLPLSPFSSLAPYILMKVSASAACLNTCHNRPAHPVGRLLNTADRTRSILISHVDRQVTNHTCQSRLKTGRHRRYWPADYRCMPSHYRLAMTCAKLARGANLPSPKYMVGQKILTYLPYPGRANLQFP